MLHRLGGNLVLALWVRPLERAHIAQTEVHSHSVAGLNSSPARGAKSRRATGSAVLPPGLLVLHQEDTDRVLDPFDLIAQVVNLGP